MIKYETNSNKVKKGDTFIAIKGKNNDGHDYINDAIKKGATKIISEKDIERNIPIEVVKSTKEYLQKTLVKEYSNNFKDIKIIAITGTNGKTTSAYITYQLLNLLNEKACYIGTIGYIDADETEELQNTTPDILTLYKLLEKAKSKKIKYIVMEVSSHSLAENRIEGLNFEVVGFTNFTQDHLDYHKTMDNYLKDKLKILNYLKHKNNLVVNSDDDFSKYFTEKSKTHVSYGKKGNIKIKEVKYHANYTTLKFETQNKTYKINYDLANEFNIYNVLLSVGILIKCNFPINSIVKTVHNIKAPSGRCESIKTGNSTAIIDYAHTPDAVEKVIKSYKKITDKKVITLIGCGGDRDCTKRPIMGKIATDSSDYVIFTNDNPRSEDEEKIMKDILKGVSKNNYEIIYNRSLAIKKGLEILNDEDIFLVLGKGHEDYQIIGNKKHHFSDKEEIIKNF